MMEKSPNHIIEEILNRTLDIISLLYGENFTAVKYGDLATIMVPPHHFVTPETANEKKILELTKQIIELLSGEIPIRCEDTGVYLSMEEQQYLEGHKELYTEAIMEDQPMDGSRKRNPSERFPRPPYSRNSSQEIPHHCQVYPPERSSCLPYSRDSIIEGYKIPSHYQERCPQPAHQRSSTLEKSGNPCHYENEDLTDLTDENIEKTWVRGDQLKMVTIKEEERQVRGGQQPKKDSMAVTIKEEETQLTIKPEETLVRGDQQSAEEAVMIVTIKEEEDELQVRSGHRSTQEAELIEEVTDSPNVFSAHGQSVWTPGSHLALSPVCILDATQDSSRRTIFGADIHQGLNICERPTDSDESFPNTSLKHHTGTQKEKRFSCSECGKCFDFKSYLEAHRRSHTGERPFSCAECGKCFVHKFSLDRHKKYHTPDQLLSCSECGKNFTSRSDLLRHHKSHTGEKPHTCPECGKSFVHKFYLTTHLRSHTGEKPYKCPECGKSYLLKSQLTVHLRFHAGLKPFSCSECGKNFMWRRDLFQHLRVHTRDKPYSCSQCGKKFSTKSYFERHQRNHTEVTYH